MAALRMAIRSYATLILALALPALGAGQAAAQIWDCTDGKMRYLTNINPAKPHYLCLSKDEPRRWVVASEFAPGCQYVERQPGGTCRVVAVGTATGSSARPAKPAPDPAEQFRESLKVGDRTNLGLVIEVKPPIAKVQTPEAERWFRIDELQPQR